jgi:hypothetical protein
VGGTCLIAKVSNKDMRYWLYLAAKLIISAAVVLGLEIGVRNLFPAYELTPFGPITNLFLHDMFYTFVVFGVWLVGAGLFYLVIWDQRRRCRTCLRRLMMPVNSGSWGNMLRLGRPMTEYICPFGHGTLQIDELQITGKNSPYWQPHGDNIWKELESYHHPAGK